MCCGYVVCFLDMGSVCFIQVLFDFVFLVWQVIVVCYGCGGDFEDVNDVFLFGYEVLLYLIMKLVNVSFNSFNSNDGM